VKPNQCECGHPRTAHVPMTLDPGRTTERNVDPCEAHVERTTSLEASNLSPGSMTTVVTYDCRCDDFKAVRDATV
jgi:hypothetical protein